MNGKVCATLLVSLLVADNFDFLTAKKFSRCDLAKDLYFKHRFPRRMIPSLICVAETGSNLDTSAISELKEDGSRSHGLFQINEKDFCSEEKENKSECKSECGKFRDDNLDDDIRCVRQIIHTHGLNYWDEWINTCKGRYLMHYTHKCFV